MTVSEKKRGRGGDNFLGRLHKSQKTGHQKLKINYFLVAQRDPSLELGVVAHTPPSFWEAEAERNTEGPGVQGPTSAIFIAWATRGSLSK